MGKRLTTIVTRNGDSGQTRLGDGRSVPKHHPRVTATGSVDELNSVLGTILAEPLPDALREAVVQLQHDLFEVGAELAVPGMERITQRDVDRLEAVLEGWNRQLEPLDEFILPGGTRAAAACHLARTVCRRAERDLVALGEAEPLSAPLVAFLNRLSDLLFILSRKLNQEAGVPDTLWQPREKH